MTTLLIDTSHERGLVAFINNFKLLLTIPLPVGLQSSASLFPTIQLGFERLKLTPQNLSSVAVTIGPGAFTGIRVGVATAQGIAYPRNLPIQRLCSLQGFLTEEGDAALIDARIGGGFVLTSDTKPWFVSQDKLADALKGYRRIVGPYLKRFAFPNQIETWPDPLALIKNPLPQQTDHLDLCYTPH